MVQETSNKNKIYCFINVQAYSVHPFTHFIFYLSQSLSSRLYCRHLNQYIYMGMRPIECFISVVVSVGSIKPKTFCCLWLHKTIKLIDEWEILSKMFLGVSMERCKFNVNKRMICGLKNSVLLARWLWNTSIIHLLN